MNKSAQPLRRQVAWAAGLALVLAAGTPHAAVPASAVAGAPATAPAAADDSTVAALGDLGLALLLQGAAGNAVISPVATASALGMVHAGTAGAAEREIEALFGVQRAGSRALKTRLPALFKQLGSGPTAMAGRMWMDTGTAAAVPAGYKHRLATRWGADAARVAFKDAEGARKQINTWTAEHTAGRIAELLPAGSITSATQLALTTAVHFRSPWEKPFDAARTEPRAFASAPGKSQNVPTMVDERSVAQTRVDGTLVMEVPFSAAANAAGQPGPGGYALLLAVPGEGRSTEQLLQAMNGRELARWRGALQPARCELALPKFNIQPQSGSLKSALQSLGVKTVFTDQADLRPMLGRNAHTMHLDDVHHAAGITIDEQGGEAVAAAAATVRAKSISLPAPACAVDRAFVFAVVHRASGTPLFVGRVTDPMAAP
jgi:serine protease inhibitor